MMKTFSWATYIVSGISFIFLSNEILIAFMLM